MDKTETPIKGVRKKKGTRRQFDKAFDPVAKEIGHVVRLWNELHEHLGTIFALLLSPDNIMMPLAAWHKQSSDYNQREMLRAVVKVWIYHHRERTQIKDEILWLVNECDSKLRDRRNDFVHAPMTTFMDCDTYEFTVEANYWQNHSRALKLKGKNLIEELRLLREQTYVLTRYSVSIWVHLRTNHPLIARPKIPTALPDRAETRGKRDRHIMTSL